MSSTYAEIELAIKEVAALIGAQKAILFGSLARGTDTKRSDVDVAFVQNTSLRFLDRLDQPLLLLTDRIRGRALDVLVYTPTELERMCSEENHFILRLLKEGRVLYES
ncbi:MAG: nucleotidyltransferase domain-containing protein [bacterium]